MPKAKAKARKAPMRKHTRRVNTKNSKTGYKIPFLYQGKKLPKRNALLFALAFGLLGVLALILTRAATVTLAVVEAESMALSSGVTKTSDGIGVVFNSNSTINGQFTLPVNSKATNLVIKAKGDQCSGAPQVAIQVDGVQVGAASVSSSGWYDYSSTVSIASGAHTLTLSASNTGQVQAGNSGKTKCSRNLYVDKVIIIGDDGAVSLTEKAQGKPATASSTNIGSDGTSLEANKGNDGSVTTRWGSSYADNQWWQVDLGASTPVSKVEVNWETAYASHYYIQGSNDGTNFTTLADVYSTQAGPKATSFSETNVRYVRILGLTRATSWGFSILEAKVFGSGSSPTVSTPTGGATAPPGSKIYWGGFLDGNDTYDYYYGPDGTWGSAPWDSNTWNKFEANAGKKVSILHFGQPRPWLQAFHPGPLNLINARGAIPYLDMDSGINIDAGDGYNTTELAKIARGERDSSIIAWANSAKAYGKPFLFRWNREMNGLWYDYGKEETRNPGIYVKSWQHMHNLIAPIAPNVTWVWCPNIDPDNNKTSLTQLYPGDAYVDWTCLDGYNQSTSTYWRSFSDLYKPTYDKITLSIAPNKPMMIGEIGSREVGGSKASWITDLLSTQLPNNFPKIKAISWFNWRIYEDGQYNPWPIESSDTSLAAFKQAIASPYYAPGGSYGSLPPLTKVQPPQ
jgi:hypothetical protein